MMLSTLIALVTLPQCFSSYLRHGRKLDQTDGDPIGVFGGAYLTIADVVTSRNNLAEVDEHGYLKAFYQPSIKTFSMDVGFNRGQTSSTWLQRLPHMFVIGIEANAGLVSRFEHSPEFAAIRERAILIRAAAGSKPGVVRLNPGFGWENVSDTGSVFHWSDPNREKQRLKFVHNELLVRSARMDKLLARVPPPLYDSTKNIPNTPFQDRSNFQNNNSTKTSFVWDTFKVDIQGADVDAMISVGPDFIKRFLCVVGEFSIAHYAVPKDYPTDPAPFLIENGFVKVFSGGNSIWLNKMLVEEYRKQPNHYACHRVYDSVCDPSELLKNFDAGGLK